MCCALSGAGQQPCLQKDPSRSHERQMSNELASTSAVAGPLPQLASACPGWVCYAEKTHGEYILPFISTAKSPQVRETLLAASFQVCGRLKTAAKHDQHDVCR